MNAFAPPPRFLTANELVEGPFSKTYRPSRREQRDQHEFIWLGDLPVAVLEPAGRFYIAPDHLGSPHQITDASGAVVWLWHPDPFGNGDPQGAFAYELRFPGQFFDQGTKLHYNYFRDYDPRTGRYIESDPIGLAGGINTYAYVGSNPLVRTDAREHLEKYPNPY